MLTVTFRHIELGDFADPNVIERRKYAELSMKSYKMEVQPVS